MSSQAYSPGLKRKDDYIVAKTRLLSIQGEVLVKEGDMVSQDTIVARTSIPGEPNMVRVAYVLNVDNDQIERFMLKKVGEAVKTKECLARYSSFFGFSKKEVLSPITGTLEYISPVTGQVIVRGAPDPVEVRSYIPGKIVKVMPRQGVIVQTRAAFIQGIFGVGGETHGELAMACETPKDILEVDQVASDCRGKILVGGSLVTGQALKKAVKEGVKGVVVGGIEDRDLMDLLGYEVGVAITGHEDCGLTLVITEGFGKMVMSNKTFELLKKFDGKTACINGATQIRAGVMRPEIIVPLSETLSETGGDEDAASEGLTVGTPIRVIREPYFGAFGRVRALPVELQPLETKSQVRVLEAELDDGRKVVVPRANVEIIEE